MKIAQMIDWLILGGTQRMMINLIKKLHLLGMNITVISLRSSMETSIKQDLDALGVRLVIFPFPKLFSLRSFIDLLAFLRREKFDLIQANLTYSNIIGGLAGWLTGTPVIGSLRNVGGDPRDVSVKRVLLDTFSLKYFCKRILANGFAVAEFARKRLGNVRIDVIPNAVSLISPLSSEMRKQLRTEIALDPERLIIFSAGRFDARKGFSVLLHAFALTHAEFPETILVLAGDGDLRKELQALIEELKIREHVVLLGFREDVQTLLASVDIYVNSSLSEGMAVSILEAMSAGLPVIATSVGDTPNVILPGMGILVSPGNSDELVAALERLLKFHELRSEMGAAARERILKNYSPESWLRKILKLYIDVTPKAETYLSNLSEYDRQGSRVIGRGA